MSIYPGQPAAAPRSRNQRTVGARFLLRLMVIFRLSVCTGEGIARECASGLETGEATIYQKGDRKWLAQR